MGYNIKHNHGLPFISSTENCINISDLRPLTPVNQTLTQNKRLNPQTSKKTLSYYDTYNLNSKRISRLLKTKDLNHKLPATKVCLLNRSFLALLTCFSGRKQVFPLLSMIPFKPGL